MKEIKDSEIESLVSESQVNADVIREAQKNLAEQRRVAQLGNYQNAINTLDSNVTAQVNVLRAARAAEKAAKSKLVAIVQARESFIATGSARKFAETQHPGKSDQDYYIRNYFPAFVETSK